MDVCVLPVLRAQGAVRPHLSCLIDSEPGSVENFGDAVPLQGEAVHSHTTLLMYQCFAVVIFAGNECLCLHV